MGNRTRGADYAGLIPLLFACGTFLLGGLVGCAFGATVRDEAAKQVNTYLTDFIVLAQSGQLTWPVPATIWNQGRWFVLCLLFGGSRIGVAVLPILLAARGFLLVFSVSCFLRFLGSAGILAAVILFGIPALFWIPALIIAGTLGMASSFRVLLGRCSGTAALSSYGQTARRELLLSIVLIVLCVFLECGLLPYLLPVAARILV